MTYFRINPVLALLLLLTAIAAALPFISYAPNRLVSGEGRHLWQLWPQTLWMLVGVGCAWLTACFIPAKKGSIFCTHSGAIRLRIAGVGSWKGGDTTGAKW